MRRNQTPAETSSVATALKQSIQPLPEEVVAQIKSSTTITSLNGVVVELLRNALDAHATRVDVTVDYPRGGCVVEDDGLGIAPAEFKDSGSLGRPYCTSKYYAEEPLLGRHGTFLASLSALSLLSIVSHHHEYRSHNSVTLHHAKVIERQTPSSAQYHITTKHGTRVTMRNLFGNLPVRVKQRSLVSEDRTGIDKLITTLKRDVTGLLLSWQGSVSIKVRDTSNRVLLSYNTSSPSNNTSQHGGRQGYPRSSQLTYMLNVLTQAQYVDVEDWNYWIPASASTSSVLIKGAISLDPSPTKHVQFVSLGNSPLNVDSGHNELYDEVNRLFALSSYGTTEDDAEVNDSEKLRRQGDQRFKHDGYTIRQLKARKDVDRHPAFHLQISLRTKDSAVPLVNRISDETMLQSILDVMRAMITQWLVIHHFQPVQPRRRPARPASAAAASKSTTELSHTSLRDDKRKAEGKNWQISASDFEPSRPVSAPMAIRKQKSALNKPSQHVPEKREHRAFAQWSRIKSGKPEFFEHGLRPLSTNWTRLDQKSQHKEPDTCGKFASNGSNSGPESIFDGSAATSRFFAEANNQVAQESEEDDTIIWTDPSTNKTFLLNARTGCVMPDSGKMNGSSLATPLSVMTQKDLNKPLRLASRFGNPGHERTPFLDDVLKAWENPVFSVGEKRIQQVKSAEMGHAPELPRAQHGHCSHSSTKESSDAAGVASHNKFSKEDLLNARVIAQVDKKFILVQMTPEVQMEDNGNRPSGVLVLVDQHAADERIQVEQLLSELCAPVVHSDQATAYQSRLGHRAQVHSKLLDKPLQFTISAMEQSHFITHAVRFAAWGILYDVPLRATQEQPSISRTNKSQRLLSISALPPTVASRCQADPQVLISFLRSTVWKYTEDSHIPALIPPPQPSSQTQTSTSAHGDWVRRLASCPQGLIDMINSRACRSAIMFNDELNLQECEDLVRKLAECTFPFMCAHGRPSMVPIVGLEGMGAGFDSDDSEDEEREIGFVEKWKEWKGSGYKIGT